MKQLSQPPQSRRLSRRLLSRRLLSLGLLLAGLGSSLPAAAEGEPESGALRPPPRVPISEIITLDGYFRLRLSGYNNLDLDLGTQPGNGEPLFPTSLSGGETIGSADARLRLDLSINIGQSVSAHARIDALDGTLSGSTPAGFPPARWAPLPMAAARSEPPQAGSNAFVNSIRLKRAWVEVLTPVGALVFGRMGLPRWGLGMLAAGSDEIDQDFDDEVDRVGFATSFADHFAGVSIDWSSIGPTTAQSGGGPLAQPVDLTLADNAWTVSASIARLPGDDAVVRRRAAGRPTFQYGAWLSYRWQRVDFPTYYIDGIASEDEEWEDGDAVVRGLRAFTTDLWFRFDHGPLRLELELALMTARIGDPSAEPGISLPTLRGLQLGGLFESELALAQRKVGLKMTLGLASGDPAPGLGIAPPLDQVVGVAGDFDAPQFEFGVDDRIDNFRFHPNYHLDVVFWRRVAGTVTDAFIVRPALVLTPGPHFRIEAAGIFSAAMARSSTPTGGGFYGAEFDLSAVWTPVAGFEARAEVGIFLPGDGLRPADFGALRTAQAGRLILAARW